MSDNGTVTPLLEVELRPLEGKRVAAVARLDEHRLAAAEKRSQRRSLEGLFRRAKLLDGPSGQTSGPEWLSDEMIDKTRRAVKKQRGKPFTVRQIVRDVGSSEASVRKALKALLAKGEVQAAGRRVPTGNRSAQPAHHFVVSKNGSGPEARPSQTDDGLFAEVQDALRPFLDRLNDLTAELAEIEQEAAQEREVITTIDKVMRAGGLLGPAKSGRKKKKILPVSDAMLDRVWGAIEELASSDFTVRHVAEAAGTSDSSTVKAAVELLRAEGRVTLLGPRKSADSTYNGGKKPIHYRRNGG